MGSKGGGGRLKGEGGKGVEFSRDPPETHRLWSVCDLNPSPPHTQQNVSLRGPGADKNEGGGVGRDPPPKKCQSEGGPGLTFPNVKNDAGASTKAL